MLLSSVAFVTMKQLDRHQNNRHSTRAEQNRNLDIDLLGDHFPVAFGSVYVAYNSGGRGAGAGAPVAIAAATLMAHDTCAASTNKCI